MSDEVKKEKKPWFNRIWSAVTGLVIGIAAMFGVSTTQISDIKNDAKEAYAKIQEIQAYIENKQYADAIKAANEAAESIKQIIGEIKDTTDGINEAYKEYKKSIEGVKTAIEAKDYKKAHDLAIDLSVKLVDKVPADQLTGIEKSVYDILVVLIKDIDEGKYDHAVEFAGKILDLFNKKDVPAPVAPETVEVPAVPETK